MKLLSQFLIATTTFTVLSAFAGSETQWAFPVSASFGVGTMESKDLDLKSRVMNAFSVEVLPSYRLGSWLFGPHLDYRMQGQTTSVSDAGGTNLKGNAYLVGLGARNDLNDKLFIQGSVDFIGEYDFARNTVSDEDDKILSPLSIRIKSGYAFFERIPNLTLDADFQYLTFKKIHIAGTDSSATTTQMFAAVGLTYQFGFGQRTQSAPVEAAKVEKVQDQPAPAQVAQQGKVKEEPQAAPAPQEQQQMAEAKKEEQQKELAKVMDVKKVGDSLQLDLSGANFASGSAALTPEGKAKLEKVAESLKASNDPIRIEGHTDGSGDAKKNLKLSQDRADSVKAIFVGSGISAERIKTSGFGPNKPVADNKSKEGRAKNRRVEIFIDPSKP